MRNLLASLLTGMLSGTGTYFVSIWALGYTVAIAMPQGFSGRLWDALVVFPLGAGLVAFLIHFSVSRIFSPRAIPAFIGFLGASFLALTITGQALHAHKAVIAWFVGALFASLVDGWLRPNNSFKPTPLRGAA